MIAQYTIDMMGLNIVINSRCAGITVDDGKFGKHSKNNSSIINTSNNTE